MQFLQELDHFLASIRLMHMAVRAAKAMKGALPVCSQHTALPRSWLSLPLQEE